MSFFDKAINAAQDHRYAEPDRLRAILISKDHPSIKPHGEIAPQSSRMGLIARIALWYQHHQAYATLMAMDDRLLRDIGIRRHEVRAALIGQGSIKRPNRL